jgi:hypothetical protein
MLDVYNVEWGANLITFGISQEYTPETDAADFNVYLNASR